MVQKRFFLCPASEPWYLRSTKKRCKSCYFSLVELISLSNCRFDFSIQVSHKNTARIWGGKDWKVICYGPWSESWRVSSFWTMESRLHHLDIQILFASEYRFETVFNFENILFSLSAYFDDCIRIMKVHS